MDCRSWPHYGGWLQSSLLRTSVRTRNQKFGKRWPPNQLKVGLLSQDTFPEQWRWSLLAQDLDQLRRRSLQAVSLQTGWEVFWEVEKSTTSELFVPSADPDANKADKPVPEADRQIQCSPLPQQNKLPSLGPALEHRIQTNLATVPGIRLAGWRINQELRHFSVYESAHEQADYWEEAQRCDEHDQT